MKDIKHYFSSPDKSPEGEINCGQTKNYEVSKNNEVHGNIKGIKRKEPLNRSKNDSFRKKQKSEHEIDLFKRSVSGDIHEPKKVAVEFAQANFETITTFNDRGTEESNASENSLNGETINDSNIKLVIEDSEDSDDATKAVERKYHKVKRKKVNKCGSSVRLHSSKTVKSRLKRVNKCDKQTESTSNAISDANNVRKLNLCKLNIIVSKQIRASKDVAVENTVKFLSESKNTERTICESEITGTDNIHSFNSKDPSSNDDVPGNASYDYRSKNNLLSYFSKVPKVDVFSQAEKIEVIAVVHPPPFIQSCGFSIEENNTKLSNKRKKSSEKMTDADKIEFVRSEIMDVDNVNLMNPDKVTNKEELSASKSWKMRIRLRDVCQESGTEDVESGINIFDTYYIKYFPFYSMTLSNTFDSYKNCEGNNFSNSLQAFNHCWEVNAFIVFL